MVSVPDIAPATPSDTVIIQAELQDIHAVLRVRGELVYGCAAVLDKVLSELPDDIADIMLDMADVTFMDTAGLQFLQLADNYSHRRQVPVETVNWAGQPRRVLELSGYDTGESDQAPGGPTSAAWPESPDHTPISSPVALERAEQVEQLRAENEQLRNAIVSRPVIDQARGILMAAHGCTAERAWGILVDASQHTNVKLRTIASAVVEATNGQAPPVEIGRALKLAGAQQT